MRAAVFGTHGDGDFVGVEVAFQGDLDLLDEAVLEPSVEVLPKSILGVFDQQAPSLHLHHHLVDHQWHHSTDHNEVMAVAVLPHPLHILMSLLDHQGILFSQDLPLERDLLIDAAFDGRAGWERLELCYLFMVEVHHTMFWPGQLVFALLVEPDAPGFDGVVG